MERKGNIKHPTWMDAVYDRWAKVFDTISVLLFVSFFVAVLLRWEAEWMLWVALLFAFLYSGRVLWLMRAIRKGTARPVRVSPRQRLISAWLSAGWFFLFGLAGLLLTEGAPWYTRAVMWTMVLLSVGAGLWLSVRKRPAASDRSAT